MADIVNSLFGLSPQKIKQQQFENDLAMARLYAQDPRAGDRMLGFQAGAGLGRGILGGLGFEDPELKRARELEEVLLETQQQVGEADFSNPAVLYPTLAENLKKRGYGREATQVLLQGQSAINEKKLTDAKLLTEEAQLEKARKGDKTSLSNVGKLLLERAAYAQAGDTESVAIIDEAIKKETKGNENVKRSAFAQTLLDAGFQEGSPEFQAKMREFIATDLEGKKKGSGTNVSVSVGGTTIDSGKVSEEAGKVVGKDVGTIEGKYAAKDSVSNAKKLLDKGINAGFYGPAKQVLTKATGIGSEEKVQNTEEFLSEIGNVVIPRLQEFGGNDSVEELKYLRAVMAGDITLEPKSIKRILDNAERKIKLGIERTQRQVESSSKGKAPPLDAGPSREGSSGTPKATKRFNPDTGKIEAI